MPGNKNSESIFLNNFIQNLDFPEDKELVAYLQEIIKISNIIKIELEKARKSKIIGSSLEAQVIINSGDKNFEFIKNSLENIKLAAIISDIKLNLSENNNLEIIIKNLLAKNAIDAGCILRI
jgi:isoleucyl-tRNA synthetase